MYKVFKQVIPQDTLSYLQDYTLFVKELTEFFQGKPKSNGSGKYWQGVDMASSLPLATDIQNQTLFDIYTSDWMFKLVTQFIPKPYLYNDQIVVKMPGEEFEFQSHTDNQFGPLKEDKTLVTQNFMMILDDFTQENGALKVRGTTQWQELLPKAGDIVMIEGNTPHYSGKNKSNKPRRVYLCHYADRQMGKDFQSGFYYQEFNGSS